MVDLVARDLPTCWSNWRTRLKVADGVRRLDRGAPVVAFEEDWRSRLLSVITNPGLALLLMMIIYGLVFEFSNPGLVAPSVIGAICCCWRCSRCNCCQ